MTIHVYGQRMPHDPVIIVGDRVDLEKLRDAIDRAIKQRDATQCVSSAAFLAYTNDGEGYALTVKCRDGISDLAVPYSDACFRNAKGETP